MMKKLFLFFFLLVTILVKGYAKGEEERVDKAFKELSPGVPGASVIVIKDDSIYFEKHYGYANLELKQKPNSLTTYNLGTISKQFTAVAILKLIESKKIYFSTSLKEIFTELPEYTSKITINHLLKHQSGLKDYTITNGFLNEGKIQPSDFFNFIREEDSTLFRPGSRNHYNYTDYVILALVIERITKKDFIKYMKKKIFRPLKMKNTYIQFENSTKANNKAVPYNPIDSGFIEIQVFKDRNSIGNGGLYTCTSDFFKWNKALLNGDIINKELLDSGYTAGFINPRTANERPYYGLGGQKYNVYNTHYILEGGVSPGYTCSLLRIPADNICTFIMINRSAVFNMKKLTIKTNNPFTHKYLYPGK